MGSIGLVVARDSHVRSHRRRALDGLFAALAVVPPLICVVYLLTRDTADWSRLLDDDSYYYLGVARNIVAGDGSSFAGATETNGYQPLWLLLLLPAALVVRDAAALVVAMVLVQGALWVLGVREMRRIGQALSGDLCALVGVMSLGVLAVVMRILSFSGMETGLLLVLLLLAVRLVVDLDDVARSYRTLGIVLALVCLCRLDAAAAAVALVVVVLWRLRPSELGLGRRLALLVGPSVGALMALAVTNVVLFRTPLPVSGQAKAIGGPFFGTRPLTEALTLPIGTTSTWLGAIAPALVGVAWLLHRGTESEVRRRVLALAVGFVAAQAMLLVYLTVWSSYGTLAWYNYNTAMMLFLGGMLCFLAMERSWGAWVGRVVPAAAVAYVVGLVPLVFLADGPTSPASVPAARFVDAELPPGATLAMGDRAGAVGYFANRPLFQLEGLVADADYVEQLASGGAIERMVAEDVDYYVRYTRRVDDGTPVGADCRRLAEPVYSDVDLFAVVVCDQDLVYEAAVGSGEALRIWRFRPELQPS